MLRLTIDLVPFGEEEGTEKIGEMIIGNIKMLPENYADYVYGFRDDHGVERYGMVYDFDRSTGVWDLITTCLNAEHTAVPESLQDLIEGKFRP